MKRIYLALLLTTAINSLMYADAQTYSADNTGENIRDRSGQNPTAENQSNRKFDVKTTAKLRRQIMRTRGMSQDAQNIKIINEDGYIVLRGPVDNEREKMVIEDLTRQCCGGNFRNELEVKTN